MIMKYLPEEIVLLLGFQCKIYFLFVPGKLYRSFPFTKMSPSEKYFVHSISPQSVKERFQDNPENNPHFVDKGRGSSNVDKQWGGGSFFVDKKIP